VLRALGQPAAASAALLAAAELEATAPAAPFALVPRRCGWRDT
jgi:hypothetical protein